MGSTVFHAQQLDSFKLMYPTTKFEDENTSAVVVTDVRAVGFVVMIDNQNLGYVVTARVLLA